MVRKEEVEKRRSKGKFKRIRKTEKEKKVKRKGSEVMKCSLI